MPYDLWRAKQGPFVFCMHSRSNVTKSTKETNNQVSLEVVSFGSLLNVSCAFTNKKQRKKKLQSRLNLQHITILLFS